MKKITFLTGTRADFGKLKSLIDISSASEDFEVSIFVTGMHMQKQYGHTVSEIMSYGYPDVYCFINRTEERSMDQTLAKTIEGFSDYIREHSPDLIVVHGDRVEALAGAISGALNNILVAHIEGGEVSGTIDELVRHAVSKMSHLHFVSNDDAKRRLIQMGEIDENIFVIGSPDVDAMFSESLPSLDEAYKRYELDFEQYGILMFHPVTTEVDDMAEYSQNLVDAVINSGQNFIAIHPNNDLGSSEIMREFRRFKDLDRIKLFPSLRFEYFLTLLKHAQFIIGNSSAGIMEAPYYGVPSVNIGTRQNNRSSNEDLIHCNYATLDIAAAIDKALQVTLKPIQLFGEGNSSGAFMEVVSQKDFWKVSTQKLFKDLS